MTITGAVPTNWLTFQGGTSKFPPRPHGEGDPRAAVRFHSRGLQAAAIFQFRAYVTVMSSVPPWKLELDTKYECPLISSLNSEDISCFKTRFLLLHHISDPKPSAHNPQVTQLAVTSWHQPKIFILLSFRVRNKAGGRKVFSTSSLTMAKKMQEIAGKVNSLYLNVPFSILLHSGRIY